MFDPKVKDAVASARAIVTVAPEQTMLDALHTMRMHSVHHAIVMTGNVALGYVSAFSLLGSALSNDPGTLADTKVVAWMSPLKVRVDETTTLKETLALMRGHDTDFLPIYHDGILVGVITERDLLLVLEGILEGKHLGKNALGFSERVLANPMAQSAMALIGQIGI